MNKIPELLAPAGSPEALISAYKAGADAVYCGVNEFNARKRAKNFSRDELEGATAFLHSNEKKIFVTLNTIVYDPEIEALIDLLFFLEKIEVDAVIVQDIGVMNLVATHFPKLALHASTQTFAHNSLQCEAFKSLGVKRIILPRELSLHEIAQIKSRVPMEYEVFIHGAMCFSFSGLCLASSHLLKSSGNRGECKQLCRHEYLDPTGKKLHPFSMKDLDASPILKELLELNLTSFKIEGRLKRADFVYNTVSYYRKLLDEYANSGTISPNSRLQSQRASSAGYFTEKEYGKIVAPDSQGTIGEEIGPAEIKTNGEIKLFVKTKLNKGSQIRIVRSNGAVVCEGTLLDFNTKQSANTYIITWKNKSAIATNEKLKTIYIGASLPSDFSQLFCRAINSKKGEKINLSLKWKEGSFICAAQSQNSTLILNSVISVENLMDSDNSRNELADKIKAIFSKSGNYSFEVASVSIEMPSGKFIPPKTIKNMWRTLCASIEEQVIKNRVSAENSIHLRKTNLITIHRSKSELLAGDTNKDKQISRPYESPALFTPENSLAKEKEIILLKIKEGRKLLVAPSIGWLFFMQQFASKIKVIAGPYIYCVNRWTLESITRIGAAGFLLSPDIDEKQIGAIGESRYRIFAEAPDNTNDLFITRLQPPATHYLYKDKEIIIEKEGAYNKVVCRQINSF